jgi:carbamoyltransferase
MRIIGISAYYHDSAAALLVDGEIVAAAQEERFTRKKHDPSFPTNAVRYCLEAAGCRLSRIDHIVFYEKPFLKFERLVETYLAFAPRGYRSFAASMPLWLKEKLFQKRLLVDDLQSIDPDFEPARLMFAEHHCSHAASAFFPSPFDEAVVLTLDGVGEWATGTAAVGRGRSLAIEKEMHFPHSLGLLYSAFTYYLGFKVNSGEYKVMGLAPYGSPRFAALIRKELIDVKADGSFWLNQDYFDYCTGLTMTNEAFSRLLGRPARRPDRELLTEFHMDVAASVQAVTDDIVLALTRSLAKEYGLRSLCLAGGVALNCVANGKVMRDGVFPRLWIQPAAGDAGGAIGAAYAAWHLELGNERPGGANHDHMCGAFLGPEYDQSDIERRLADAGAAFETVDDDTLVARTADALAEGKVVGWFQGRMEFGPRALGARSILGDPRSPQMQKTMNLKIKYRESFRPFAPSVLREDVADWFELQDDSPYMLLVANVRPDKRRPMSAQDEALFGIDKLNVSRSSIPAVTHVDYSARIQTVHEETNPRYHALLSAFKARTGVPILVNTSFNVRGEPIVCEPEDAFRCFMGTELDMLVCGNAILLKSEQRPHLKHDRSRQFELD